MGAGLPLPSGAVRTDRRTQAAGDARRPAGRRQEAQSPGTHHPSGVGGGRGEAPGGPATPRQEARSRYRQSPPSLPGPPQPLQTHPPFASPAPDTLTHRSSPGRWALRERPLGAGRTHPGRHPPAGHRWPRAAAGGGWRRQPLLGGAGAGGTRTLALFSHTHTHSGCD